MVKITRLFIYLTSFFITAFIGPTFSQNDESIVEGPFFYYSVSTPKGWIRDSPQNLEVAFLPDKKSKKDGSNFAYVVSSKIDTLNGESIQSVISFDQSDFKGRHPDVIYQKQNDIITPKNKNSTVYYLTIKSENYYEVIAYISIPSGVLTVIMHSKKESDRQKYLPQFEELVKSCFWVSEKKEIFILPGK